MVISGCVGPRGDGYDPDCADERGGGAGAITREQIRALPKRGATW